MGKKEMNREEGRPGNPISESNEGSQKWNPALLRGFPWRRVKKRFQSVYNRTLPIGRHGRTPHITIRGRSGAKATARRRSPVGSQEDLVRHDSFSSSCHTFLCVLVLYAGTRDR